VLGPLRAQGPPENADAKGAAVADLDFRSGCRILRIDGKEAPDGSLLRKTKASKRDS
jgi:hypothetical protein